MTKLEQLCEELSSITVKEMAELVKMLEGRWGVSAAAPVAVVAAAAAPAAAAEAEVTEFDIELTSFAADKKVAVIKVIREITGLGLKEAKDLVEAAPKLIKQAVSKDEAAKMKALIEAAGGTVTQKQAQ